MNSDLSQPYHIVLKYFSVGSAFQNVLFYSVIIGLVYLNIFLVRQKNKLPLNSDIPDYNDDSDMSNEPQADKPVITYPEFKALAKTNSDLNNEVMALKNELLALGEEVELAYMKSDKLNDQLSEILDCLDLAIEHDDDLWHWSLDLNSNEITLSDYGLSIHGLPGGSKLTLSQAMTIVDAEDREAIAEAIQYSITTGADYLMKYKINPVNGGSQKWLKSTGKVRYDEEGRAKDLTGKFTLSHNEYLNNKQNQQ